MLWLLFLFLTTLSWGIYDIFFKGLETRINYFLALAIIGLCQFLIAIPFLIFYYLKGELIFPNIKSYGLVIVMGVLLGLGTIFFFYTFKFGALASIAIPVYSIGVAFVGALGGILIFKETLNLKMAIGFFLGAVSIILLTAK
jgi:uncharacterized membrane protein